MLKPQVFQQANVAVRNLPYTVLEEDLRSSLDAGGVLGGVLGSGQLVWTEGACTARPRPHSARAFVEGIGMVMLDPRWLSTPRG